MLVYSAIRTTALGALLCACDVRLASQPAPIDELREAARLDSLQRCSEAEVVYRRLLAAPRPSLPLLNNAGNHYLTCGAPAKARSFFKQVLAIKPGHPNASLQMARLELYAGAASKALFYLSGTQDQTPAANLIRGEALYRSGKQGLALDVLGRVEALAVTDPSLLFATGATYESIGRFERAEELFIRLLAERPEDPALLFRAGRAASRAKHFDRARRALEAALKLRPSDVETMLELGLLHAARREPEKAVYVLSKARQLASDRPDVLLALARAAEEAGYYGDATLAYDEYLKLNPKDESARRDRAVLYGLTPSKLSDGRRDLTAYLQKHASDPMGWFHLARLTWSSDPQAAIGYLNRSLRLDPAAPAALFARAWLLLRAGRAAESLQDLKAALAIEPGNVKILTQLGLSYLTIDKPAEAERALRQALTKAPEDPDVLLHLGRALVSLDQPEEAQIYLMKFQKVRPQVLRAPLMGPGMIELATVPQAERTQREIQRLRSESRSHPGDLQLQLHLASLLFAAGDSEEALTQFRDLLTRNPDGALAHTAGAFLLKNRQYDLAREFLERAAGGRAQAGLDLAVATWRTEGVPAALRVLDAIPATDRSSAYFLLRAKILDADGSTAQATKMLDMGLQAAASSPELACDAALLLVKQDRPADAMRLIEQSTARTTTEPDRDPYLPVLKAGVLALVGRVQDAEAIVKTAELRWPEFHGAYLMHAYLLAQAGRPAQARKKAETAVALGADTAAAACLLTEDPAPASGCSLRNLVSSMPCAR